MSMVADSARFSPDEARAAARDFDLKRLPADFIDDPFPYYRALREHDPVHRMPDGAYLITRWRDCDAVYRDARVFSSDKKIEFRPKYGDTPLYRAPHHQPRVQRSAAAHPCAPRDPDGAVEPRDRRDGGGAGRAGRPAARRDGGKRAAPT